MPRKAKENEELKNIEKKNISTKSNTTSTKKTTTKKTTNQKKSTTKKAPKTSSTKKKTVSTKTRKTSTSTKKQSKPTITEYYDLPEKYNQTIVKILAQTPKTLFIYWEISDSDIENYKKQYGENFFETTKPVLIIHNDNLNYSFEVEINDFANSWYLHVEDTKCDYQIELGRRPRNAYVNIPHNYLYISSSNDLESPNDHILFEYLSNHVLFQNVKTGQTHDRYMNAFLSADGKLFNIYELYQRIYGKELITFADRLDLSNPSSGNPSSTFR